jgi:probable HAF family extracellular repeat protein
MGLAQRTKVEVLNHSKTLCYAVAINRSRDVIGVREITERAFLRQIPFFQSSGKKPVDLPMLTGYTNLEIESLSDTGLVVGYASRAEAKPGKTTAFVWDSNTGKIEDLGQLPDDVNAHAQDISSDGKRITGYSVGANPARLRPCLWEYSDESKKWVAQVLPTIDRLNPFLQSGRVVISPNGKWIAGCATVKHYSESIVDSSLMVWQQNGSVWERRIVHDDQPKLKDINDQGVMVGSFLQDRIARACIVTSDGKLERIDLLEGDESNVATGINNAGVVVGYSDDPKGGEGGPVAFIFKDGKVLPLDIGEAIVNSSAAGINESGAIAGYLVRDTDDSSVMGFILANSDK